MEEEYRLQKAQTSSAANGETSKPMTLVNGDGSREGSADDNASTRGVPDVPSTPGSSDSGESADAETMVENLQVSEGVPEIRISTESDRENEASTAALEKRNDDTKNADGEAHDPKASVATTHALEKPIQAAANEEEENAMSPNSRETHEAFSFTNKRLCERWLDNLFMVLYEVDLHVINGLQIYLIDGSDRTYESGRSSEPKWHILKRNKLHIAKQDMNGKFSETLA